MTDFAQDVLIHYRRVYDDTMKEMPVSNHRLLVEWVEWQEMAGIGAFGVLITPWFISLVVQPQEDLLSDSAKIGQVVTLTFPSGQYEFLVNYQQALGYYLTCALVSATLLIESHEVAVSLAQQMLTYLFEPTVAEKPKPAPRSELEQTLQVVEDRLDKPVSRRALFGLRDSSANSQRL